MIHGLSTPDRQEMKRIGAFIGIILALTVGAAVLADVIGNRIFHEHFENTVLAACKSGSVEVYASGIKLRAVGLDGKEVRCK